MEIKCKKSKRFLCEVNIEDYVSILKKLGISQEIPLILTVPCRNCKEVEEYGIYENHYIFRGNKVRSNKCIDKKI